MSTTATSIGQGFATGVATGVAIQASEQSAQNLRAAKANCEANIKTFTHNGSTVEQQQTYASCVQLLHPAPEAGTAWAGKVVVVLLLVGLLGGAVTGCRQPAYGESKWVIAVFYALFGFAAVGLVACLFALLNKLISM